MVGQDGWITDDINLIIKDILEKEDEKSDLRE